MSDETGRPRTDSDLLSLISLGEITALEAMYDRHIKALWRVALLGSKSEEGAEQAVEGAFRGLWLSPEQNGRTSVSARLLASVSRVARHSRPIQSSEGGRGMRTELEGPPRSIMATVNREIDRLHSSFGLADSAFFCECGAIGCKERIALSRSEYALLRAESRPLLVPAHENGDRARDAGGTLHGLGRAVGARSTIEQAKGLLAGRGDMTLDDAFEVLRGRARSQRRSLEEICAAFVADVTRHGAPAEGEAPRAALPVRIGERNGR